MLLQEGLKGIVHPNMKITPWFTHPQAILGIYLHLHLADTYPKWLTNEDNGSNQNQQKSYMQVAWQVFTNTNMYLFFCNYIINKKKIDKIQKE